jgi:nitrogen regulatory protein P-II 1
MNDVNNLLAQARIGGVTHYRIDGKGRNTSIFIPETKVEVVIRDEQVETLLSAIVEKLSSKK